MHCHDYSKRLKTSATKQNATNSIFFSGMPGPPLPRPVLPRERGYMDRVVEYLVGDGPSNRFALICKQCQSHNGMALKEEFEYIGEHMRNFYNFIIPKYFSLNMLSFY